MRKLIIAASILCLGCLISTNANAQSGTAATCARILWQYVGKPVIAELAKKASGDVAAYFYDKAKQGQTLLTQNDIQQIQNLGVTPCQLRQALENQTSAIQTYSAQAYCSITGVVGTAHQMPSPLQALQGAIYDCINRGGVPQCCQHGAVLTQK